MGQPHGQQNGVVIWDGLLMDATEQILVEKKAAELAAIVEGAHDAIKGKTLEGIVTSWNPAAEQLYGYTAKEMIGQHIARLLPSDRLDEIDHLLARIAQGERVDSFDTVRRAKDGTLLDVSLTMSPIWDKAGQVVGASTIAQDIRRRKESESKLAHLAAIVDGSHDAILSKTLEGIITSWNPAAEQLFGYTAEEMIGTTLTRLLPSDRLQEVDDLLNRIISGEKVNSFETVRCAKNGALLDVSLTISPIKDSAGRLIGASTIAHDITQRKRMSGELAAAAARDKRIAETLQRTMLQASPIDKFPLVCVESLYQAALDESYLGGDFFDAFSLNGNKVALVVGDVSGKGLIAAARTAEVKYALRALLHEYEAPEIALAHLNHFICETLRLDSDNGETFIMLALAVMDTITGETVFASAGPEPTFILRKGGKAEPVEIIGMPLGIELDEVYTAESRVLESGETVIFATDGITEARCGRAFLGCDGLALLVEKAGANAPLSILSKTIYDGALHFSKGDLRDDVCLLLARRQS